MADPRSSILLAPGLEPSGPTTETERLAPGATTSLEALSLLQGATQRLLALLDESQRRLVAASAEIKQGQKGEGLLWNELFQEAFTLQSFRKQVEVIQASSDALQLSVQAKVNLADPEQPLTGVPLGRPVSLSLGLSLDRLERFWILSTLHALSGNRSQCADSLGIALRTVRNKLNEYRRDGFKVPAPGKPLGRKLLDKTRASLSVPTPQRSLRASL